MSESLNTADGPEYPCTQCGICCKKLNTIETTLPYDETGRCFFLIDTFTPKGLPISMCSIYPDRESRGCPSLNSLMEYTPPGTSWDELHATMAHGCNQMQEAYGMHEVYRVILPPKSGE